MAENIRTATGRRDPRIKSASNPPLPPSPQKLNLCHGPLQSNQVLFQTFGPKTEYMAGSDSCILDTPLFAATAISTCSQDFKQKKNSKTKANKSDTTSCAGKTNTRKQETNTSAELQLRDLASRSNLHKCPSDPRLPKLQNMFAAPVGSPLLASENIITSKKDDPSESVFSSPQCSSVHHNVANKKTQQCEQHLKNF